MMDNQADHVPLTHTATTNKANESGGDDEETIEEEERLCQKTNEQNLKEIEMLKKESELPLETLLMMYKNGNGNAQPGINQQGGGEGDDEEDDDDYDDYDDDDDDDDDDGSEDDGDDEGDDTTQETTARLKEYYTNLCEYSGDEEDLDFDPSMFNEKKIRIGDEHQANLPTLLQPGQVDPQPIELNELLLWSPLRLAESLVLGYLKTIQCVDEETALCHLNNYNYVIADALGANTARLVHKDDLMSQWSDEDNQAFEDGLKELGKDFAGICEKKLNKKYTIREIINYYYIWKKSARHDLFIEQFKIKKRYYSNLLNPFITDYMERFMSEREQQLKECLTTETVTSGGIEAGTTNGVTASGE